MDDITNTLLNLLNSLNGIVWGPIMLVLILGTGIYLSIGLKGLTISQLGNAFKSLWQGRSSEQAGEISPFNALMTSLSATIGTGNIAGVGLAIAIGGPGALFWMWITALFGMATKYAEAVLAVNFRETDQNGQHIGGPMYYIKNGLSQNWHFLAYAFAAFGVMAAFGIGNTVQSNSIADALNESFNLSPKITGIILMLVVAAVILGGIKRIANVAGKLVPLMAIAYLVAGLTILLIHASAIPQAFALIIDSAFNGHAATGGFAGAAMIAAIRHGVARGIFSNEAGLGSAPIAHAHAQTNNPVQQGKIAMLGTFIDTIIICSITGLVIVVTGVWQSGESGVPLTAAAFNTGIFSGFGHSIVAISLSIFAFTTIIGWSVYGERCAQFLFNDKAVIIFRILWVIAVPIGAITELKTIWLLADTLNALMALPNLIALLLLSPIVFKLSQTTTKETT